jgi:hypothetical protein
MEPQRTKLVKESAAAEILGLSVCTLRGWRLAGKGLGYLKLGRTVRYDLEILQKFIDQARRESTSQTRD